MILLLLPLVVFVICSILFHKIRDVDTNECIRAIGGVALCVFLALGIICFFIRLCDYDKFQIDAERANIVRYIERYGDDAETNEATYNRV